MTPRAAAGAGATDPTAVPLAVVAPASVAPEPLPTGWPASTAIRIAVLADAAAHVAAVHPGMARVVDAAGPPGLARRPRQTHFQALARSITYQQLAGRAVSTIHRRFVEAVGGTVTPETVLAAGEQPLRGAGLSGAKTAAILDLADRVARGDLRLARIGRLPDDEVVADLVRVRGIGRWTAQMFLLGQLGRLDVWPSGDLGVRSGYARVFGLAEMPGPGELDVLGDPFRPYRSVAAWYCWRAVDTALPLD